MSAVTVAPVFNGVLQAETLMPGRGGNCAPREAAGLIGARLHGQPASTAPRHACRPPAPVPPSRHSTACSVQRAVRFVMWQQ